MDGDDVIVGWIVRVTSCIFWLLFITLVRIGYPTLQCYAKASKLTKLANWLSADDWEDETSKMQDQHQEKYTKNIP